MAEVSWEEVQKLAPGFIGGVINADEGRVGERTGIITSIVFEKGMIRVSAEQIRRIVSDNKSVPDPYMGGWSANMEYSKNPRVSDDGMISFWIPMIGTAYLYPKGHSEILAHWIS